MTEQRIIDAYEESLRGIALATVRCRAQVSGFNVPQNAARELLVECERHLSALIALNAVPGAPQTERAIHPPPNIADTCCGRCPGDTCYVDQITGA